MILACAQRVLAEVDGLHSELEEMTGLLRGQLRIGGVYPTGPYDVFGMLAAFRAAHPEVAVHMIEDTQDGVLEALRADELDCAFTALNPDTLGDEFAATLLMRGGDRRGAARRPSRCARARGSPSRSSRRRTSSPTATTPRCDGDSSPPADRAPRPRAAQRVHLHGDGRGAGPDVQGPRRRRHAEVGRGGCPDPPVELRTVGPNASLGRSRSSGARGGVRRTAGQGLPRRSLSTTRSAPSSLSCASPEYPPPMSRASLLAVGVLALALTVPVSATAAPKPPPGGSTARAQVFTPNPVQQLGDETLTDQKDADYFSAVLRSGGLQAGALTDLDGSAR